MKKSLLFVSALSLGAIALSVQGISKITLSNYDKANAHIKFTSGPPTGKTGAPGEGNCTDCHAGSTLDGAAVNTLTIRNTSGTAVTSYVAGATYAVTLEMSQAAPKRGFQIVALTGTGASIAQAGTVTGNVTGGSQTLAGLAPFTARTYVLHTATGTASPLGWAFSWVAPATGLGPVTFYIATNKTNSSDTYEGDVVYLSTKVIAEAGASLSENNANQSNFVLGYNSDKNAINVSFDAISVADNTIVITDMKGKTVHFARLGENELGNNKMTFELPENLKTGMYNATVMFGNTPMSSKIMINK